MSLYTFGETRTLFDTVSKAQSSLNNKKGDDAAIKRCLANLIGLLSETHGLKIVSLFAESLNVLLKLYKNAKEMDVILV